MMLVIPHPRLGIDRFADGAEHAQGTQIVFRRPFIAEPDERADGRGRGVKGIDLELLDDFPETSGIGKCRNAFEHQRRRAVAKRAVNDVAVAGDPADVGGAEINIVVVDIENVFVRERAPEQITGGAVDDAFGFAGRAGSIKDEQKILGVHFFRRTIGGRLRHQIVIPDVAARHEIARLVVAFDDDDFFDARRFFQRLVGDFLERNRFAAAQRNIRRDQQFATRNR